MVCVVYILCTFYVSVSLFRVCCVFGSKVELVADSLEGMESLVAALAKSKSKSKRGDVKLRATLAEVRLAGSSAKCAALDLQYSSQHVSMSAYPKRYSLLVVICAVWRSCGC